MSKLIWPLFCFSASFPDGLGARKAESCQTPTSEVLRSMQCDAKAIWKQVKRRMCTCLQASHAKHRNAFELGFLGRRNDVASSSLPNGLVFLSINSGRKKNRSPTSFGMDCCCISVYQTPPSSHIQNLFFYRFFNLILWFIQQALVKTQIFPLLFSQKPSFYPFKIFP